MKLLAKGLLSLVWVALGLGLLVLAVRLRVPFRSNLPEAWLLGALALGPLLQLLALWLPSDNRRNPWLCHLELAFTSLFASAFLGGGLYFAFTFIKDVVLAPRAGLVGFLFGLGGSLFGLAVAAVALIGARVSFRQCFPAPDVGPSGPVRSPAAAAQVPLK